MAGMNVENTNPISPFVAFVAEAEESAEVAARRIPLRVRSASVIIAKQRARMRQRLRFLRIADANSVNTITFSWR
jgi:hypothetical protein